MNYGLPTCVLCGGRRWRRLFAKRGYGFARCRACGLVSLTPLPPVADLQAHHAECYASGTYKAFTAADDIRTAIAASRFAGLAALAPGGPWLEVGCGTGAFLRVAAQAGVDIEGLDLSPDAVAIARAAGLVVHRVAVEEFRPLRRYVAVVAFDVVEHLHNPRVFVAAARRWLVPGGLVALTLPDVGSWMARLMGRWWFQYWPPDHVHYFDRSTIRRLLEAGGFRDVRARGVRKPLTLAYVAERLRDTNPSQARLVDAVTGLLPRAERRRGLMVPTGEMLVTARAG